MINGDRSHKISIGIKEVVLHQIYVGSSNWERMLWRLISGTGEMWSIWRDCVGFPWEGAHFLLESLRVVIFQFNYDPIETNNCVYIDLP